MVGWLRMLMGCRFVVVVVVWFYVCMKLWWLMKKMLLLIEVSMCVVCVCFLVLW